MKYPWDHVYIMNLAKNKDRKKNVIKELKKNNFDMSKVKFIDAVNGMDFLKVLPGNNKDASDNNIREVNVILERKGIISKNSYTRRSINNKKIFNLGEIGLFLSIHKAFKEAKKNKDKIFLILEDDVQFIENFEKTFFKHYKNLPKVWDIFSLSWIKTDKKVIGDKTNNYIITPYQYEFYRKKLLYIGAESLIIKNTCLDLLIDNWFPMDFQSENKIDMFKNSGLLRLYCPPFNLTKQNVEDFDSDIQ